MDYQILPHLADLKIKVFGKTKEEIFLNTLKAINEFLKPEIIENQNSKNREIKIESMDLATLFIDFLNEVLYLIQINKESYHDVEFKKFNILSNKIILEAELRGKKVKRFNEDIKAATYHNLEFCQKEDKTWKATVLFDV